MYRTTSNRIVELTLGSAWNDQDITASGPLAAGDPFAYVRSDGVNAVVYRGTSNRVIELAIGSAFDLSGAAVTTVDPTAFLDVDGSSDVIFPTASNHVNELVLPLGAGWSAHELSATQANP